MNKCKDGGEKSTVTSFTLIEMKTLFSIMILKFEGESRECYHTHAFNCINWVIKGKLTEVFLNSSNSQYHVQSLIPFIVRRNDFHKVSSLGTSWVLTFRGSWVDRWKEYTEQDKEYTLTHGRNRAWT